MSFSTPGSVSLADSLASLVRSNGDGGDGGLALYRAVAEQLPGGGVFVVNRDLRYVLAAGPALRMSGVEPGDFEGRALRDAVPPELLAQYTQDYLAILGGGRIEREHCVGGVWYVSHGVPLADEHGCVHAALVFSYDITGRKRQEGRSQLLELLSGIVRSAADSAEVARGAGALLEEYFGTVRCVSMRLGEDLEAAEVDGISLRCFGEDVVDRLARGARVDSGRQAGAPGLPASVAAFLLCPHLGAGQLTGITALLSSAPLTWNEDDAALACEVAERAWIHMDRLRLLEALEEADRRKARQLALLAQELRQPLNVGHSSLALLARPGAAVATQAVAALIDRQFGNMKRMIEDAVDTSYGGYPHAALRPHRLVLQEAVLAAVDAARALVSAETHDFSLVLAPQPMSVFADPVRLAQALNNLLANAIKYTRAPARIRVEVERSGAQALVRISDNGIGMSARTLATLFAPDGGAGGQDAAPAGGLGVGLWITRRLLEEHGGSIRGDSPGPDLGSTFTMALPVVAVH